MKAVEKRHTITFGGYYINAVKVNQLADSGDIMGCRVSVPVAYSKQQCDTFLQGFHKKFQDVSNRFDIVEIEDLPAQGKVGTAADVQSVYDAAPVSEPDAGEVDADAKSSDEIQVDEGEVGEPEVDDIPELIFSNPVKIPEQLRGEKFIMLSNKGKEPLYGVPWALPENQHDAGYIEAFCESSGGNYGVIYSKDTMLSVVDADSGFLMQGVADALDTYAVRSGRTDSVGYHLYLRIDKEADSNHKLIGKKLLLKKDGEDVGDIRLPGFTGYNCGPFCIHPSGNKYLPENDKPIRTITIDEILKILDDNGISYDYEGSKRERQYKTRNDIVENIYNGYDGISAYGVNVRHFLEPLNPRVNSDGSLQGRHPIHDSTNGFNLRVKADGSCWYCYRHHVGGGVMKAIAVANRIIECEKADRDLTKDEVKQCFQILDKMRPDIAEKKLAAYKQKKHEEQLALMAQADKELAEGKKQGENVDSEIDSQTTQEEDKKLRMGLKYLKENALYQGKQNALSGDVLKDTQILCEKIAKFVPTIKHLDEIFRGSPFFVQNYPNGDGWDDDKAETIYKAAWDTRTNNNQGDVGKVKDAEEAPANLETQEEVFSESVLEEAKTVYESGNVLEYIAGKCGQIHFGNAHIIKLMILTYASTRVLNGKGINLSVTGESGRGKSDSIEAAYRALPQNDILDSSMSEQVLYYAGLHPGTLMIFDDQQLSETQMEIVKKLKHDRPTKRITVDNMKLRVLVIPPQCAFVLMKVEGSGDEQIENRVIYARADNSQEYYLGRYDFAKWGVMHPNELKKRFEAVDNCRAIWKYVPMNQSVIIPYADKIKGGDLINLRTLFLFMDMIMGVALLASAKRERTENGEIIANLSDFETAAELMNPLLENISGSQSLKITETQQKILDYFTDKKSDDYLEEVVIGELNMSPTTFKDAMYGKSNARDKSIMSKIQGLKLEKHLITIIDENDTRRRITKNKNVMVWNRENFMRWKNTQGTRFYIESN